MLATLSWHNALCTLTWHICRFIALLIEGTVLPTCPSRRWMFQAPSGVAEIPTFCCGSFELIWLSANDQFLTSRTFDTQTMVNRCQTFNARLVVWASKIEQWDYTAKCWCTSTLAMTELANSRHLMLPGHWSWMSGNEWCFHEQFLLFLCLTAMLLTNLLDLVCITVAKVVISKYVWPLFMLGKILVPFCPQVYKKKRHLPASRERFSFSFHLWILTVSTYNHNSEVLGCELDISRTESRIACDGFLWKSYYCPRLYRDCLCY